MLEKRRFFGKPKFFIKSRNFGTDIDHMYMYFKLTNYLLLNFLNYGNYTHRLEKEREQLNKILFHLIHGDTK